jgi:hypothetical protein
MKITGVKVTNCPFSKTPDTRNACLDGLSYSWTDCDLVTAGGMPIPVILGCILILPPL